MKYAVITDTHFGVRNNAKEFLNHMVDFTHKVFLPELEKRNIKRICHLGDLVDNRIKIDVNIAKVMRETFFEPIKERGISIDIIPGNHDVYYKNTLEVNALTELSSYDNVNVILKPDTIEGSILMVPWICQDNASDVLLDIKQVQARYCFGHFEINGFEMHKGHLCEHGLNQTIFKKFDVVASGHFHKRSSKGNIHYLGSPYQMTWNDWGDERGFSIFDTDIGEFEFIPNPINMFEKITFDPDDDVDLSVYKNKYIKVIVKEKGDPLKYEKFITKLEEVNPYDLKIVNDVLDLDIENAEEIIENANDVFELLSEYVDKIGVEERKDEVKSFLKELYKEAQLLEV